MYNNRQKKKTENIIAWPSVKVAEKLCFATLRRTYKTAVQVVTIGEISSGPVSFSPKARYVRF